VNQRGDFDWCHAYIVTQNAMPQPQIDHHSSFKQVSAHAGSTEPLGSKIRRLRVERNLGQERLAIEAGVDQSGLSKFERGKANRSIGESALRRLAGVLELSFEDLISDTNYKAR